MIPSYETSSYAAYEGNCDYTLTDRGMGGVKGGKDALIGWMTVALTTERGAYPIFSKEFGVAFGDDAVLEQSIRATLSRDERIRSVDKVEIIRERGSVSARVTVRTVYGACETEIECNV